MQRAQLGGFGAARFAEQQRDDVGFGQRRVRLECGAQLVGRAGGADRHAIRLARHADVGLRLDVEERIQAGGIGELDRPARHLVAASLEDELTALGFGAAEEQRAIVRPLQLEIGAGHHLHEIVVDVQRRRDEDLHIELERHRRWGSGDARAATGLCALRQL